MTALWLFLNNGGYMEKIIEFNNVSKFYDSQTHALNDVSISIEKGEFAFIVGASGAGKSTFLKLIMHEETPSEGTIVVNGTEVTNLKRKKIPYLRRDMGIVFQDFRLIEKMTVYDNVAFAMRAIGASPAEVKERVPYILGLVGLSHKINNRPSELSGGEQQRVSLARALVNNPAIIIADEPTGNIDPEMSYEIIELLAKINEESGTTILVVTHEHELVKQFNKRVIEIEKGRVISDTNGAFALFEDIDSEDETENGGDSDDNSEDASGENAEPESGEDAPEEEEKASKPEQEEAHEEEEEASKPEQDEATEEEEKASKPEQEEAPEEEEEASEPEQDEAPEEEEEASEPEQEEAPEEEEEASEPEQEETPEEEEKASEPEREEAHEETEEASKPDREETPEGEEENNNNTEEEKELTAEDILASLSIKKDTKIDDASVDAVLAELRGLDGEE